LIQNTCQNYFEPNSTCQNHCAAVLAAARGIVQQWLADPKNIDLRMAGEEGMAAIKSHFKP
jgi:hypothetical protein